MATPVPNEFDELLAGYGEDEEVEATEAVAAPKLDNKVIKQIRDHAKKLEKELAQTRKEADELKTWKAETESRSRTQVLSAAGFNEKQAQAFLAMNQEVSSEAIQSFKSEVLGQGEAPESASRNDTSSGFGPTDTSGERSGTTAGGYVTRQEFEQIMRQNPAKGDELVRSGKVLFNNINK